MGAENAHETGLAGRYATAMFELAQDDKSVDAVAADFAAIKAAIQSSPSARPSALLVGALAIAVAIGMIVDLDTPFDGFILVSPAPMLAALAQMQAP